MRGTQTDSQFTTGLVAGFLTTVILLAGLSVVKWAASTDVVAALTAWATTPVEVTPLDVLNLLPLVLTVLVIYIAVGAMPR